MDRTHSTNNDALDHLVILGGGTAGWMAAAAIGKVFKNSAMAITVIESSEIGTVGVGEATIPEIINFNNALGIDEKEFIKHTNGTFKLGIEFEDWLEPGHSYIHPFGRYGTSVGSVPFFHYWQRMHNLNKARPLADYCLSIHACNANKFARPVNIPNSPLSEIDYAYHFDAGLYADYLRRFALACGVRCIDAKVTGVIKNRENGFIQTLALDSGEKVDGDFFIDCTGFRGVLIEQALHSGYDDWSHLLPCDSAVTVASPALEPLPPYTRATAKEAGWQWRIPLQHRTGNGYVYSSNHLTDERAQQSLLDNIEGAPLNEPKVLRFKTGMRRKHWNKNCLALGLSAGFLEPLESTSIHLIYEGIANFLGLFPDKNPRPAMAEKYNQLQLRNFTNVRDLLVFHYWSTKRDDSQFWRDCRDLKLPDRLKRKVELYKSSGRIFREDNELFSDISWISVFQGQGLHAAAYNPIADDIAETSLEQKLEDIYRVIVNSCEPMPQHKEYIEKYILGALRN